MCPTSAPSVAVPWSRAPRCVQLGGPAAERAHAQGCWPAQAQPSLTRVRQAGRVVPR